jgi:hypothetical protein
VAVSFDGVITPSFSPKTPMTSMLAQARRSREVAHRKQQVSSE